MIEQLKELLEMQRVLDESIFKEKGIKEYPVENMKIALFVELGELLNEFPKKFKHWKKTAKNDREKGLVEYVDCLHFALSLTNYNEIEVEAQMNLEFNVFEYEQYDGMMSFGTELLDNIVNDEMFRLSYLFDLGKILGFTWEEIYQAYKEKNAVNYERLKSGY